MYVAIIGVTFLSGCIVDICTRLSCTAGHCARGGWEYLGLETIVAHCCSLNLPFDREFRIYV